MEPPPRIEVVRGTRSRYDRATGRHVVTHHAYVIVDGRRLSDEDSQAWLRSAYERTGGRAPVVTPVVGA